MCAPFMAHVRAFGNRSGGHTWRCLVVAFVLLEPERPTLAAIPELPRSSLLGDSGRRKLLFRIVVRFRPRRP